MNPPATPPPDGPYAEYFKNGSVSCTGTYQNGLRTGGWQFFLLNGQVKATAHCAEGTMTFVETKPGELVRPRMDFRTLFAPTHTVDLTFKPEGHRTVVAWSRYGPNNFMGKAIGLFIDCDKMCGDQFAKGPATLKSLAEAAPAS